MPQIDPARVQLVLPERLVITRAFQLVPGAALVEAVRRQAAARFAAPLEGTAPGAIALVPAARPDDLRVPTGDVELDVRLQEGPPGSAFLAAQVTVRVNGRDHQTIPLTFRAGRYQRVVVAARQLEPRAVLGATDFRTESRPSTELPPDALEAMEDPADLEALRPIRAGEVVTARMVRPKVLVRRGEIVTLLLEGQGFRITTQGRAAEDARRGDSVRVVNVTSKREVLGTVESAGLVRVPFGR
jgi:flagella basal body P-ring formation protein FlgA